MFSLYHNVYAKRPYGVISLANLKAYTEGASLAFHCPSELAHLENLEQWLNDLPIRPTMLNESVRVHEAAWVYSSKGKDALRSFSPVYQPAGVAGGDSRAVTKWSNVIGIDYDGLESDAQLADVLDALRELPAYLHAYPSMSRKGIHVLMDAGQGVANDEPAITSDESYRVAFSLLLPRLPLKEFVDPHSAEPTRLFTPAPAAVYSPPVDSRALDRIGVKEELRRRHRQKEERRKAYRENFEASDETKARYVREHLGVIGCAMPSDYHSWLGFLMAVARSGVVDEDTALSWCSGDMRKNRATIKSTWRKAEGSHDYGGVMKIIADAGGQLFKDWVKDQS